MTCTNTISSLKACGRVVAGKSKRVNSVFLRSTKQFKVLTIVLTKQFKVLTVLLLKLLNKIKQLKA